MSKKSWKWICAYEQARKKYGVEESKVIANKTIKKRVIKKYKDNTPLWFPMR